MKKKKICYTFAEILKNKKRMKKLIIASFVAASFAACNNATQVESNPAVATATSWVDSIVNLGTADSAALAGYEAAYASATTGIDTAKLNAEDKAKLAAAAAKWAAYAEAKKAELEAAKTAATTTTTAPAAMLAEAATWAGVSMKDDKDFSFLTGANAAGVYDKFLGAIKGRKEADWTTESLANAKAFYEGMDAFKNTIEKDMSAGDKLKVAASKVKIAGFFAGQKIENKTEGK